MVEVKITGRAVWRTDRNQGERGLTIKIWDADNDAAEDTLDEVITKAEGYFDAYFEIDEVVVEGDEGGQIILRELLFVAYRDGEEVGSTSSTPNDSIMLRVQPPSGEPDEEEPENGFSTEFLGEIRDSLKDMAAYMPTTYETNGGGRYHSPGEKSTLDTIIDRAFSDVLGLRMKSDKPSVIIDAMGQVFNFEETNGKRKLKFTPRTFTVETELGAALTGAQAVLYNYFKQTASSIFKSISALRSLGTDTDNEDAAASTAILKNSLTELVEEVGRTGGPRNTRVTQLFSRIDGQIEALKEEYDLDSDKVTLVDEERVLTEFLMLEELASALKNSWARFSQQPAYLGTSLVDLSRSLAVISNGVAESYRAMDAVALDLSERQTITILDEIIEDVEVVLTIEELLSWIDRVATQVAPELIHYGGKRGLQAIYDEIVLLQSYTQTAADITPEEARELHPGLSRPRVLRALKELAIHLNQVVELIDELMDVNGGN